MIHLLNQLQELIISLAVEDIDLFIERIATSQEYKELITQIKELSTKHGGLDINQIVLIMCAEALENARSSNYILNKLNL